MKIKTFFIFIVLNIFTLLAVTILYEYISIDDKLEQLERTVDLALERAVYNATASEELFTKDRAQMGDLVTYSYGVGSGSFAKTQTVENALPVWNGSEFVRANSYGLTIDNVGFPISSSGNHVGWRGSQSSSNFNLTNVNGYDSVQVFTYLYGQPRGTYMSYSGATGVSLNTSMNWANNTRQTDKDAMVNMTGKVLQTTNSMIQPSSPTGDLFDNGVRKDFEEYYHAIGSKVLTGNFVKVKDGEGYRLEYAVYPVLADMGMRVTASDGNDYSNSPQIKILSSGTSEVDAGNPVMTDNWGQSIKVGKQYIESTGTVKRSNYYLTPYSLGVTYIPKDVVKETFIANLDTMCRLNKLASGRTLWDDGASSADAKTILNSATGCIKDGKGQETSIYPGGGSTAQQHIKGADEVIINDGRIEYDLNSIQMKIEYFLVDFWDERNATVLHQCVGEVAQAYDLSGSVSNLQVFKNNLNDYKNSNSGFKYLTNTKNQHYKLWVNGTYKDINLGAGYEKNQGKAIVAKVTARIKVHIPYDNAIIQWTVHNYTNHGAGKSEHYDIKMYNESATSAANFRDGADEFESGVWYQTSTYFAVTR